RTQTPRANPKLCRSTSAACGSPIGIARRFRYWPPNILSPLLLLRVAQRQLASADLEIALELQNCLRRNRHAAQTERAQRRKLDELVHRGVTHIGAGQIHRQQL